MARVVGLICFVLVLFGMSTAVEAARTPGLPNGFQPAKVYPAKLHVAGGLTITSTKDTLEHCSPGQAWTMIEKVDLVINDEVTVQSLSNKIASSTFARDPGGVDQVSRVRDYRTTNYCPPTAPAKLTKPQCGTTGGTALASLGPDPRLNGQISIAMTRHGSSRQDHTCWGPRVDASPKGTLLTALQTPFMGIDLPLKLQAKRLRTLKIGGRLISRIEISGPCKFAIAAPDPVHKATSDETCEVDGFFNVLVKRLRK